MHEVIYKIKKISRGTKFIKLIFEQLAVKVIALKTLWFVGAGLSILQIIIGNIMVLYAVLKPLLYLHIAIGIILFGFSLFCLRYAKRGIIRRMLLGNIGLIVTTGILGLIWLLVIKNPIIPLIHLFLALGLVSNFSVMYGIERGTN